MLKRFLSIIKFHFFYQDEEKEFYNIIKDITGLYPSDLSYYRLAFQHSSLMLKDDNGIALSNERLEFLGDAVIEVVISDHLFNKFPDKNEGFLTVIRSRIVSRHNLNALAIKMGLKDLIKSKPHNNLIHTHIPGDTLEALIGAIYTDLGIKPASRFIQTKILSEQIDFSEILGTENNYKSLLIEWAQKYRYEINYITEEYSKPLHNRKTFIAKVYVNEVLYGEGKGNTKKEAQQNAACKCFDTIKIKFPELTIRNINLINNQNLMDNNHKN